MSASHPFSPALNLQGGSLLAFVPMTTEDGASEFFSCGFFDEEDEPPWDTWLWYINEEGPTRQQLLDKSGTAVWAALDCPYLVSWVPPQFKASASVGVEKGNSMFSLLWLELVDSPFTRRLRNLGILDPIEGA
ncbi:MAG: hypothetical protein LC772_04035 [Chloroflexi bacterium]|nr:hypothetical protein [Chloroflexota bacterium]